MILPADSVDEDQTELQAGVAFFAQLSWSRLWLVRSAGPGSAASLPCGGAGLGTIRQRRLLKSQRKEMPYQNPFPVPKTVKPEMRRALDYWRNLKRGENDIPFADDVSLANLRNSQTFLIKVFVSPLRFRLEAAGGALQVANSVPLGRFIDEIPANGVLSFLLTQCCARVEANEPTFCHFGESDTEREFSRILLPAWGDGHIDLLLAAVA